MTYQLEELRHWISSLQPRERLFENQSAEPDMGCLDQLESDDPKPQG